MKLTFRQIDGFLKAPDPKAKAVLVYGPDEGLARERIALLGKTVVKDLGDPFNVTELNGDQIAENPSVLNDEVFALSMMGGRRLIRLHNTDDKLVPHLKAVLEDADKIDHLILIQGGDLGPRSALRKLCESSKNAAALPCYVEDERDLTRFLQDFFKEEGYQISRDALQAAASVLKGDRALVRKEAEKICLYKGEDYSQITLDDIQACLGQINAETLDILTQYMASGRAEALEESLNFLFREGNSPVYILRSAQNYFRRLYITQARLETMGMEEALKKLEPPLFFKLKPGFQAHLRQWPMPRVKNALSHLYQAEKQLKSGQLNPELICNRAFLSLARMAQSRR